MSERGDGNSFLDSLRACVRANAGKALAPLLKRWRYTQSADSAALPLRPAIARFLIRYGALDASQDRETLEKEYRALLARCSRAGGDAPGVVAAWIELFAAGQYGVLSPGICAANPRCAVCGLKAGCRYLASGARDTRVSGENLARELARASARGPVDVRASELLAFLISGEKSGAADIARAEALLKACGGVRGLLSAESDALRQLGLRPTDLARLQAVAELCRLWTEERPVRGVPFARGRDFYEAYYLRLRDLKQEAFIVIMLDQKNHAIGEEQVSAGSLTETLVHPREVFTLAIARRAASVAVVHNHPSGDPAPSAADKAITKRLASVAQLVGIRLLDHVIVGEDGFYSFAERGALH